jgi:hypothetical protein
VHLEEGETEDAPVGASDRDDVSDKTALSLDSAIFFARIAPSHIPPMNGTNDLPLSLRLTKVGTYRHAPATGAPPLDRCRGSPYPASPDSDRHRVCCLHPVMLRWE